MNKEPIHKNKLALITVIFACILLLGVTICLIAVWTSGGEGNIPEETSAPTQTEDTAVSASEATEHTIPSTAPTEETEPTEESTEATKPVNNPVVPPSPPVPTAPPKTVLHLPYTVPGTNLVIQRIAPYTGIYLEDASNDQISDVAMILLRNTGTEAVEFANITMVYDYGTLHFTASAIPAGGQVAVQEASRSGLVGGDLTSCTAEIATRPSLEMAENLIQIVDNMNNSITVTNLTDSDIVTVRIFYKYYIEDQGVYVGGITYTAKISNLKAKESITISPSHYSSEGSTVVMVRTYDTDA